MEEEIQANPKASLGQMLLSFIRIGSFTIGGGMAMLPLMEGEFVDKRRWLNHDEMLDILAVAQTLPGVIAINTSIMVGYRTRKLKGALVASAGMILPSFFVILIIATFLDSLSGITWLSRFFAGIRAGVSALLLITVIRMGSKMLNSWFTWTLSIAALLALLVFDVHFMIVIGASAVLGLAYQYIPLAFLRKKNSDKTLSSKDSDSEQKGSN